MAQQEHKDHIFLRQVKEGKFEIDPEKGIIYGSKTDMFNKRLPVGSKFSKCPVFSLLHDNRCYRYYVNRAIYLYVHKKIPKGQVVYNKDKDNKNNSIYNLILGYPQRRQSIVKFWNDEETQFLKDNYKKMSQQQIADKLNRSVKAIRHRVPLIKLPPKELNRRYWTVEEDEKLKMLYKNSKMSAKEIAKIMGKTEVSVKMRARRFLNLYRSDPHLRNLYEKSFYTSFKGANQRNSLRGKCCLCDYDKYIELHHLDGNRKNNHISNIATFCPNHHTEVSHGEHKDKLLYAIWQRKYKDGSLGELKNNLKFIEEKDKLKNA